jgi:hypothetical protein
MLFLPPANGRRTAYLGPIEDATFVATMWALWWHAIWRSWRTRHPPADRAGIFHPGGRRVGRASERIWPVRALAVRPGLGSRHSRHVLDRDLMRVLRVPLIAK